jgi:predicted O-linked N-acetylglucosamine transferase (SPINDLY family)
MNAGLLAPAGARELRHGDAPALPTVTLACVDCLVPELAIRAIERCRRLCRFARAVLFTDRAIEADGIDVVQIPPIRSRDEYSEFMLKSLVHHIATDHALVVQWDGFVVNPAAWTDEFLQYDYAGAPWPSEWGHQVGNGGFSLRSRRLLRALADPRVRRTQNEDMDICQTYRGLLESEYGIRFAPVALAERFSFEVLPPNGRPFGFHALYNFGEVFPPDELIAFLDALPVGVLARPEPAVLAAKVAAAGGLETAEQVLRTVLLKVDDPRPEATDLFRTVRAQRRAATAPTADDPRRAIELLEAGISRQHAGDLDGAREHYQRALERDPLSADALSLLGVASFELGERDRGIARLERAVALAGDVPAYQMNLGKALRDAGRTEDALLPLERAAALAPGVAEAHHNLGLGLAKLGRFDEAAERHRRAIEIDPGFTEAHADLARLFAIRGRTREAYDVLARALARQPHDGLALQLATLMPPLADSVEDIGRWREHYRSAMATLQPRKLAITDPVKEVGAPNFFLAYHGLSNRELASDCARVLARACPQLGWRALHCDRWRGPGERIRVGFVSANLYSHSIGKTSVGLIERLARERFRVFALMVPPVVEDAMSARIRAGADEAVVLGRTLEQARERIASLALDVLFYQDIGMEPFTYYLAFSRLAPVQCVSFGHPDTTGVPGMDYFVSNDLFEPPDAAAHYSENLFLLRGLPTLACYDRPEAPPAPAPRAAFGLPEGKRLYVCPQTLFKFHPEFDDILLEVLRRDPEGELVLIEPQVGDWLQLLLRRLHRRMPEALARINVVAQLDRARFLNLLAVCDVMLDTLHFNGMNTSLEAFAVGLPVVTLPGGLQRGRHTLGMYRAMGIEDGIAATPEDYVERALRLARDRDFGDDVRRRIRAASEVLFENQRVVREFERFFEHAVEARMGA